MLGVSQMSDTMAVETMQSLALNKHLAANYNPQDLLTIALKAEQATNKGWQTTVDDLVKFVQDEQAARIKQDDAIQAKMEAEFKRRDEESKKQMNAIMNAVYAKMDEEFRKRDEESNKQKQNLLNLAQEVQRLKTKNTVFKRSIICLIIEVEEFRKLSDLQTSWINEWTEYLAVIKNHIAK